MADEMDKFFGLDNPAGQAALAKEREKLDAEIKAAFGVPRRLLGKDVTYREAGAELMHCDTGTVIQKEDCALIIKPSGEPQLLVPGMKDDELVPDHVLILTAIMIRLTKEPEFAADQLDWMTSSRSS